MNDQGSSLVRLTPSQPNCRRSLLCIPSAGLGVAPFFPWAEAFLGFANVWGARLPGREKRILEEPLTTIETMAAALAESASEVAAADELIMFGHCSGALIAYELAHLIASSREPGSLILIVSSQLIPTVDRHSNHLSVANMSTPELIEYLRDIGGTPEDILHDEDLMELVEPVIRADVTAVENYRHPAHRPTLSIPLLAVGGRNDIVVDDSELRKWSIFSSGPFRVHQFDGDHFYATQRIDQVTGFLKTLYSD